jgi:hypothetical protein
MRAGAWQSSAAMQFEQALTAQRGRLRSLADGAMDDFAVAVRAEPDVVPAYDWRAGFGRPGAPRAF